MKLKDKIKQAILEAFQKRDPKEDIEDLIRQYKETGDFENIEVATDVMLENDLFGGVGKRIAKLALKRALKYHYDDGTSKRVIIAARQPWPAYWYSLEIDKGPSDILREIVLNSGDIECIMAYTYYIDKAPRDDTRKAVINSNSVTHILDYIKKIDKNQPRNDTRQAVIDSKDAKSICWYAIYVDEAPRRDTFDGVMGTSYETIYIAEIGRPEEYKQEDENLNESLNKWQEIIKG